MEKDKITQNENSTFGLSSWLLAIVPLLLLGILLWVFLATDPLTTLTGDVPPIEELTVQRVELSDGGMTVHVVNGGPEPVTIAQVLVDDAYWDHDIEPSRKIPSLGSAEVEIPYPWVEGEAHEIVLISNTGVTFDTEVEVAVESPKTDLNYWLLFALLGFYVGVIPVGLGLMWFPLLKKLGKKGLNFILALTVGLLAFLLVDTFLEGIEIAEQVPHVFQAVPLVFIAGLLSFLVLVAVSRNKSGDRSSESGRLWLATAIAIGIGLHNLGEGMAIGASIAIGEVALGTFLIIGFTLHNITEGVGIGAPMARDNPSLLRLICLVLLAGGPAIIGTWIGGFAFSPLLAVIFLAIGAGAILQVVYEVTNLLTKQSEGAGFPFTSWVNLGGLTVGIFIMYFTAYLTA